jgi:hypothetical protein
VAAATPTHPLTPRVRAAAVRLGAGAATLTSRIGRRR